MSNSLSPFQKRVIYILACISILVTAIWFIGSFEFISWDFRNELWAPSYLVWHRESAYNTTLLFPMSLAVWFPQIIGVFFPLGLLSQYQAANIWLGMNMVLLVYLIWFLTTQAGQGKPTPALFSVLLVSAFLFPPTIRLLILGQVDLLFITAAIAGMYALNQRRLMLGAFLYALALTKPQLAVVVLPCVVGYLAFIKKDRQTAVKFMLAICFFMLALTIPLWISNPAWFNDFISNILQNPRWNQPSIFFLLYSRIGKAGVIVWLVLCVSVFLILLKLWQKTAPAYAILWSIALTTIVSPYIWSWDFALLLPLLIDTAARIKTSGARIILLMFYLLCFILSTLALQPGHNASDEVLWWIPIVILTGILVSLGLSSAPARKERMGRA